MINILADKHIFKLKRYLPLRDVNIKLFDPQEGFKQIPEQINALFTRTTLKIDQELIEHFPDSLKFVATASAGTDHVDIPALKKNNIAFANAAGCNARSVAEYVATAILIWAEERNISIQNLSVGIIGAGNTGSETQKILQSLGIKTEAYDPPLQERDKKFKLASLGEVLNCDILTFHVPLTFNEKYATFYWLDEKKLSSSFKLIINASRGGVIDEKALLSAFQRNDVDDYILDVWEDEPFFRDESAKSAFIHTPHIAGYSIQAKLNGSRQVAESFCNFFNLEMPEPDEYRNKKTVHIRQNITFQKLLKQIHPIADYHRKFSRLIGKPKDLKKSGFSRIRTKHSLRNEYKTLEIPDEIKQKFEQINQLQQ